MRRIIFTVLFSLTLCFATFSQITLTYDTHSISTTENNNMVICNYADPGAAGQNVTWDFSKLQEIKDFTGIVNQHYARGNDPDFPYSNTQLTEFDNTFYFNITKKKMEETGMASKDKRVIIQYDQPFLKMKFPFTAGDAFAGSITGTYTAGEIKAAINGSYSVEADAWGKLILPGNVVANNTLRIKSVKRYNRVFSNSTQHIDIVTYRWYNEYNRYPLLVLTSIKATTGANITSTFQAAYNNRLKTTLSVKTPTLNENDLLLYPNPVADRLNVKYHVETSGPVTIELFDNTGKKIKLLLDKNLAPGDYSLEWDVRNENLPAGMYHIRAIMSGKSVTKELIRNE